MRMKRQGGRKRASAELRFLPFAAKRITRSSRTQKTNRSPFKELSISIRLVDIPSKLSDLNARKAASLNRMFNNIKRNSI